MSLREIHWKSWRVPGHFGPWRRLSLKLRYFVGLTLEETAEVLGVSVPTVKRWWSYSRAWLRAEMASRL